MSYFFLGFEFESEAERCRDIAEQWVAGSHGYVESVFRNHTDAELANKAMEEYQAGDIDELARAFAELRKTVMT